MGYTHYFETIKPLTPEFVEDVKRIVATAEAGDIIIRGWDGTGEPELSTEGIILNGDANTDHDYETFMLKADEGFNFCKTARRPYDAVVGAILIRLKKYQPSAMIDSDGVWDHRDGDGDWAGAQALYLTTFREVPVNPLSADQLQQ